MVRVEARFVGSTKPKQGSGFRLAKGRILTCQHVIEDLEEGRPLERIIVSRDPDGSGQIHQAEAECIWKGEEPSNLNGFRALDAAVLEDKFEDDPGPFKRLVRLPQDNGRWSGFGFAVYSTSTKHLHRPDGIGGSFDPVLPKQICLQVTVENNAPIKAGENQGSWGGVSGGTVFVQGGPMDGHLYGVLHQKPASHQDRLYAVLLPALLRNRGFCEAISWSEPPAPHGSLVIECRRLLKRQPELARHLQSLDEFWAKGWESNGVEGLLEAMCRTGDVKTLLEGFETLARMVKARPSDLDKLRESAGYFVSLLVEREFLRKPVELKIDGRKVHIPFASPNYAEAVQAALEGRPPLYKKQEKNLPGRVLEVPPIGLEAGIRRERHAEGQIGEIAARFVEIYFDEPPYLWEEQRNIIRGAKASDRLAVLAETIDGNLKRFAIEKGGQPYLLITPETRSGGLNRHLDLDDFLSYLAELLPSVIHLEISGDAREAIRLEFALEPLWDLLDLKWRNDS